MVRGYRRHADLAQSTPAPAAHGPGPGLRRRPGHQEGGKDAPAVRARVLRRHWSASSRGPLAVQQGAYKQIAVLVLDTNGDGVTDSVLVKAIKMGQRKRAVQRVISV